MGAGVITLSDQIHIQGLRLMGTHGVHDFEQQIAQPFEIDLALDVDLHRPGSSDDLRDTVSYVGVVAAVRQVVETENYKLIERLAERIAQVVLVETLVTGVDVTVRKPHAAVGAHIAYASVSIHRP